MILPGSPTSRSWNAISVGSITVFFCLSSAKKSLTGLLLKSTVAALSPTSVNRSVVRVSVSCVARKFKNSMLMCSMPS